MSKNEGGQAFPVPMGNGNYMYNEAQSGMTLRDYFAGEALKGLLAGGHIGPSVVVGAEQAWRYADAMLNTRESASV